MSRYYVNSSKYFLCTLKRIQQMEVAEASNEETMTATTDAASDTTTYSASTEELGTGMCF